jgi:mono/diheme cytochrome c family protein
MSKPTITTVILILAGLLSFATAHAEDIEQVFGFYCTQCHGTEGKGDGPNVTADFPVDPRNFTNAEEMEKLSDADIKNVILEGGPVVSKSAMMPPWGKTLSEEQIDALVKYLRKLCNCEAKEG